MSQAEALLNSMLESAPVHTHPVPDTDTYFVIDPITRSITNTNRKKTVVMQYDHGSERFTFELPRFVDGHDMLECTSITVNVDNIEDETGTMNSDAPDMIDLRVHPNDPDKVISSWLISRNSTQLAGVLSFHIEYKCVDDDGNIVYEWSTDKYDEIEVRARKKNGEAAVIEHTDLLEQWRTRIFGAGDSVMANIAAEGEAQVNAVKVESETQQEAVELKGAKTLDSIPEDYTETNNMVDDAVRSKGDAIVCEAAGESIVLKDSSNDHIRGLKLFGKSTQVTTNGYQLFDASILATVSKGGASITNNGDGSFTVSGSGTLTENIATLKDYTHEESLRMLKLGMLHCPLTRTMPYCYVQIRNSSEIYFGLTHSRPSYEITQAILDDEGMFIRLGFYGGIDEEIVPGTVKPILYQEGDGTWEPFSGGKAAPNPDYPQNIVNIENPTVDICGKNLVRTNNNKDVTYEGLHFLITKGLSEVVLNGTTTKSYGYAISEGTYLAPGRYTMSIHGLNNVSTKYDQAYVMNTLTRKTVCAEVKTGSPVTFEVTEGGVHRIDFLFAEGTTYNNATIRFQIEAGSEATDYKPCTPVQTITLPRPLRGLPVTTGGNYTDENGQRWICDEVDLERDVYVQRIMELVADNTLTYEKSTTTNPNGNIYFTLIHKNRNTLLSNDYTPLCDNRTIREAVADMGLNETRVAVNSVGSHMCIWFCSEADTVDEMKNSMDTYSSTFLFPLTASIESPLTAEEIIAFKALRTNYPNTTILNDAGAWMSVKYNADTKTYVENPKILKLTDSSTGVVYELKIVDGNLTVTPI